MIILNDSSVYLFLLPCYFVNFVFNFYGWIWGPWHLYKKLILPTNQKPQLKSKMTVEIVLKIRI